MIIVPKSADSSKSKKSHGEQCSDASGAVTYKIKHLIREIQAERVVLVKKKVEKNKQQLQSHVTQLVSSATIQTDVSAVEINGAGNMLSLKVKDPLCKLGGPAGDKDHANTQEFVVSSSVKLPIVERIPPYTTWIFLDRNQRMAEDQSVVGRRRIYYDQRGSEALICSDSEEETAETEEEKHEFSEAENRILRTISQEYEFDEEVIDVLTQFIGGTVSDIQEFYNMKKKEDEEKQNLNFKLHAEVSHENNKLDKSLGASLDSLDNLFCRRCLVFDCRLHGISQSVVAPSERLLSHIDTAEDGKPCGDHCYLLLRSANDNSKKQVFGGLSNAHDRTSDDECQDEASLSASEPARRKVSKQTTVIEDQNMVTNNLQSSKKLKWSAPETLSSEIGCSQVLDDNFSHNITGVEVATPNKVEAALSCCLWKPLEKELYLKGLKIFGRNSCLIARNLLSGLKTCNEVSRYMYGCDTTMSHGLPEDESCVDHKEREMSSRARLVRRRGRTRKLKYSWKSAGHPSSIWRRIADGKNQSCKQYIPCGCKSMCGKQCPCHDNGTCCEKYCGCSKSCKNRFRGCHCAKSQCRSRQCPCFAAGRECDPDVCRNCWVSCGDASLGEPPRRGDGQCGNMRLLLRQQQRIILAKSDVAGWGAFLKNAVSKNDYLGEYTGELISHREADKRGKIYDRANSSFLFDLNDQYVLDAYRKGDKLKFANHSSNPNCYAKVMLVSGDHRVGIFANEHIGAGEELFYDYRYGPDQAPAWARKPDGSQGDGSSFPQGRAKKQQSFR